MRAGIARPDAKACATRHYRSAAQEEARPLIDRIPIGAGPATFGSDQDEDDERPRRTEFVDAFAIDRTEVTWRMYRACVRSGRCLALGPLAAGGEGASEGVLDLPVTGITWAEAAAYCRFARGRLPSEREWEKAARGDDGRVYPWGDEVDCGRANWGNFDGEGPCAGQGPPGRPVAVGSYLGGASPYGVLDLAGNVWEWTADSYPGDPGRRIVKGGSCCSYFVAPRASNRNAWAPEHRDADLGFRCVSS